MTAQRPSAPSAYPSRIPRRQHQPAGEAALEVAHDPEAREDARERRRLEQDEDELECRVADGKPEAGHVVDARKPTGEGHEEEQGKREPGEQ